MNTVPNSAKPTRMLASTPMASTGWCSVKANDFQKSPSPFTRTRSRTGKGIADWLARQRDRGLLEVDDALVAAGMLRGMMVMEPQRATMLGQRKAPSVKEIAARAKTCARLFLKGCMSDPARGPVGDCP